MPSSSEEMYYRHLESIKYIGNVLNSTYNLTEFLSQTMHEITRMMNADRSTLYLVDHAKKEIWSKIVLGDQILDIRQPIGKGISGWVAEHGKPLNIDDVYTDERFDPETDRKSGYKTQSMITVPVFEPKTGGKKKVSAVIQVLNKKNTSVFNQDDLLLLESLASQIAIALQNTYLYTQLQKKINEQDLLFQIEKRASEIDTLLEILKQITERLRTYICAESALMIRIHTEGDKRYSLLSNSQSYDVREADIPLIYKEIRTTLRENKPYLRNKLRQNHPDRKFGVTSVMYIPVHYNGKTTGALRFINKKGGFTKDDQEILLRASSQIGRIIEVVKLRIQKQKQSNLSSVGNMISTIVHDLRTPLNNIKGYAELLYEEPDKNERKEFSKIIQSQSDTLMTMTQEILDFAKGETSILPRKVGVTDLIKAYYNTVRFDLIEHGIELDIENHVPNGLIYIDIQRMVRVFTNLQKNAIESYPSSEKAYIKLIVTEENNSICFCFADRGRGIPSHLHDTLFDSFVTEGKESGTGLGLAIVKKIVDEHDGYIHFESSENGTRFYIHMKKL